MGRSQQTGSGEGYKISSSALSDSLPLVRSHLLVVPQPSETALLAGDQMFMHEPFGDRSHSNHNSWSPRRRDWSTDYQKLYVTEDVSSGSETSNFIT